MELLLDSASPSGIGRFFFRFLGLTSSMALRFIVFRVDEAAAFKLFKELVLDLVLAFVEAVSAALDFAMTVD